MSKQTIIVAHLGVITQRYCSNIVVTDKDERFVGGANTGKGDILITVDGFKRVVTAKEYSEKYRQYCSDEEIKPKSGVTKALLKAAEEAGIDGAISMTKGEIIKAIEDAAQKYPPLNDGQTGNNEGTDTEDVTGGDDA